MKKYSIMRIPAYRSHKRPDTTRFVTSRPEPHRMCVIEAENGNEAITIWNTRLKSNHTCVEIRPEARYAPAFLVARIWNGSRNHHEVRYEAWLKER